MQFSSGLPFGVGVFESHAVVGCGNTKKDPYLLPNFFPDISGMFQMLKKSHDFFNITVQLDIQFTNDHRTVPYDIDVSLVRLPTIIQDLMVKTEVRELTPIALAKFVFPSDLKTFDDEPADYRHVYSLSKVLTISIPTILKKGDRLALSVKYSNIELHSICINGVLDFSKHT